MHNLKDKIDELKESILEEADRNITELRPERALELCLELDRLFEEYTSSTE